MASCTTTTLLHYNLWNEEEHVHVFPLFLSSDISLPEICRGSIRSVWAVAVSFYLSLPLALFLRVCLCILTQICANKFLDIALLFSVSAIKLTDQFQNVSVSTCALSDFVFKKSRRITFDFEEEKKWNGCVYCAPLIMSTWKATKLPPHPPVFEGLTVL